MAGAAAGGGAEGVGRPLPRRDRLDAPRRLGVQVEAKLTRTLTLTLALALALTLTLTLTLTLSQPYPQPYPQPYSWLPDIDPNLIRPQTAD